MNQFEPEGKRDWRSTRLFLDRVRPVPLALWYCLGFVLILLLPYQVRFGAPIWSLSAPQQLQSWVWATAFLNLCLVAGGLGSRPNGIHIGTTVAAALFLFGLAWTLFQLLSHPSSRAIAALSLILAVSLVLLPQWLGWRLEAAVATLGVLVLILVGLGVRSKPLAQPSRVARVPSPVAGAVATALYPVALNYQRGLVDSNETQGGAIEALDEGFLLVTGEGEFYRLDWSEERSRLTSGRLPLTPPFDRAVFRADSESIRSRTGLRVTDIGFDAGRHRLYLVHQYWNAGERCLTMRVSRTAWTASPTLSDWETVFEARPCLPLSPALDDQQSGGELAWDREGRLLLILGDNGFNGTTEPALAQQMDNDYGKVLRLDLAGGREIVSIGHRSPQGLVVDREGLTWDTEHGPQGGDEINVIRPGGNYGWPWVTYGTQYGVSYWPLARGKRDHGDFIEPVQAFVPSLALASIIQVGNRQFPDWDGDFLVGSLRAMTLYRIRTRAGHVSYVEPIPIERRIRDLAEGSDGRIVLWTDEGDLVVLAVAAGRPDGKLIYSKCTSCHGADLEGTGLGPPLRDIYGNRVAGRSGFNYSPALRRIGGLWSRPRLDAFLANPAQFAPGTNMRFEGLPDSSERMELIEYLRRQR